MVAKVALFINVTSLRMVLLPLLLWLPWLVELKFIFSLPRVTKVPLLLLIIRTPQKCFAHDQIILFADLKLMCIIYEDPACRSQ
jgi:hypothetical protein